MPIPPPEDLPNSGMEPRSPTLQADSLLFEPPYTTLFFYKLLIVCYWLLEFQVSFLLVVRISSEFHFLLFDILLF